MRSNSPIVLGDKLALVVLEQQPDGGGRAVELVDPQPLHGLPVPVFVKALVLVV